MADPSKQNSPRSLIILLALLLLVLLGAGYGTYYYYKTTTQQATEVPKIKTKKDITTDKKELIKTIPNEKIADKLLETDKRVEKATKDKEEKLKEILQDADETASKPVKTKKISKIKPEEKKALKNPLNQMPLRLSQIQSYFAPNIKNIINVDEAGFNNLQKEAFSQAGKYNPFVATDFEITTSNIEEEQLPEIFDTTDKLSISPKGKGAQDVFMDETIPDYGPKSIITTTTFNNETLDATKLTGIIGNAAVLKFNGSSRALRAGQNYRGIVVLSVDPNSVTLELNGYTVTKTIKN